MRGLINVLQNDIAYLDVVSNDVLRLAAWNEDTCKATFQVKK